MRTCSVVAVEVPISVVDRDLERNRDLDIGFGLGKDLAESGVVVEMPVEEEAVVV